jgi:hypothetical protein
MGSCQGRGCSRGGSCQQRLHLLDAVDHEHRLAHALHAPVLARLVRLGAFPGPSAPPRSRGAAMRRCVHPLRQHHQPVGRAAAADPLRLAAHLTPPSRVPFDAPGECCWTGTRCLISSSMSARRSGASSCHGGRLRSTCSMYGRRLLRATQPGVSPATSGGGFRVGRSRAFPSERALHRRRRPVPDDPQRDVVGLVPSAPYRRAEVARPAGCSAGPTLLGRCGYVTARQWHRAAAFQPVQHHQARIGAPRAALGQRRRSGLGIHRASPPADAAPPPPWPRPGSGWAAG